MRRQWRQMCSRKMYIGAMVAVPVLCALFFVSLMSVGLPLKTPVAMVDLDHSPMSRQVIRNLNAGELIEVTRYDESYDKAMAAVRSGEVFGFFVIPANFESDALGGRTPTLEYYSNMTYFVPGTLSFKGFKTTAVTTAAGVVSAVLVGVGAPSDDVAALIQPMSFQEHPMGNPWMNYSVYLSPSFIAGVIALMIFMTTCFSITMEIKNGTSPQWLQVAGGRMSTALLGKLLPQTVIFWIIGAFSMSLMWGWLHFPANGSMWWMLAAMMLFVIACQMFALLVVSIFPNPRMAFTMLALVGILSFSIAGFSFPVQNMYGGLAIFSYILPVRYYFLIYASEVLNGWPVYYCRWYFLALAAFIPVGCLMVWRLKRALLHPIYVP